MDSKQLSERLRAIDPALDGDQLRPLDVLFAYRLILGRRPDDPGWGYWMGRVGAPLEKGVTDFIKSDEAVAKWMAGAPPQLVKAKRGFSVFADPGDPTVGREIIATGDYEFNVSAFMQRELKGRTGTFVDVGANIGWFLLLAHTVAPAMRVVGFEPNPANVQLCYRSLRRAGFAEAVLYPFALTDANRFFGMYFAGSNGYVGDPEGKNVVVQGVRGDDFLAGEESIAVLKIDVEGHEPPALRGLANTIARHRPVIVSEFHPHCLRDNSGTEPAAYLEQLRGLGYSLAVIGYDAEGSEVACRDADEVLAHWRKRNEKLGGKGEIHLDLVARPAPAR